MPEPPKPTLTPLSAQQQCLKCEILPELFFSQVLQPVTVREVNVANPYHRSDTMLILTKET